MVVLASNKALTATGTAAVGCPMADGASSCAPPRCSSTLPLGSHQEQLPRQRPIATHLPATECSLGSGCPVAEGHRVSRHISRMCGRVGAGEPTFESYSVGKHSAAAPAVVSAHSQLSATRSATLLHAARRWVHLLLALVAVG